MRDSMMRMTGTSVVVLHLRVAMHPREHEHPHGYPCEKRCPGPRLVAACRSHRGISLAQSAHPLNRDIFSIMGRCAAQSQRFGLPDMQLAQPWSLT